MGLDTPRTKMPYVRLGNSGLKVSRLILGTMQYGSKEWQPWIIEEEEAMQQIKAAYDLGVQTFDTSNVYSNGISEIILGKAIKKFNLPREEIVIMVKISHFVPKSGPGDWFIRTTKNPEEYGYVNQGGLSRKHIFEAIKATLQRLQLDYVDVLQCHRADDNTPIEETMQALHDVVKAGYARYIGMGSCWAWKFQQMQNYAITNKLTPFISMQNHYNLLFRDDEIELFPTLKLFGVGAVPYSPLARGHLARPVLDMPESDTYRGKTDGFIPLYKLGPWEEDKKIISRVEMLSKKKSASMAQIALAWVLHQPGVTAPIVGPTSTEQLKDLIDAVNIQLTDDDIKLLEDSYVPRPRMMNALNLKV